MSPTYVTFNTLHLYPISPTSPTCITLNTLHFYPISPTWIFSFLIYFSFAKEFGHPDWKGYGSFIHWWAKRYGIVNKAMCGSKESAAPRINLKHGRKLFCSPLLLGIHQTTFTMVMKQPCSTSPCFDGDKPAGSAKCKDRLTLLIITNMDGSDYRKLSVKSKNPNLKPPVACKRSTKCR